MPGKFYGALANSMRLPCPLKGAARYTRISRPRIAARPLSDGRAGAAQWGHFFPKMKNAIFPIKLPSSPLKSRVQLPELFDRFTREKWESFLIVFLACTRARASTDCWESLANSCTLFYLLSSLYA